MFTLISANTTKMTAPIMIATAKSTGCHIDDLSEMLMNRWNPTSTIPDGDMVLPVPAAAPPICRIESIMAIAIRGPFVSSHQKNPVKIVKRMNSTKNSVMSACLKAISPNVQTMLIRANVQNSQLAYLEMAASHVAATL